jgi:hypothetical protein
MTSVAVRIVTSPHAGERTFFSWEFVINGRCTSYGAATSQTLHPQIIIYANIHTQNVVSFAIENNCILNLRNKLSYIVKFRPHKYADV